MSKTRSVLTFGLCAVALSLGAGTPVGLSAAAAASVTPAVAAAVAPLAPGRYGLPDFADLVDTVGPAVVNISTTQQLAGGRGGISPNDPLYDFLRRFGVPVPGMPPRGRTPNPHGEDGPQRRGVGSGFIVSEDGYVLTNAHVVADASTVTVKLSDKREFQAKVVGSDERTDVALLKIDADGLPAVKIGDAEQSRVGEWVVALGSPFGFESTVTAGIISAKARRLPDETYVPFIQTDVAINPGNSGGPLFNLAGEVIGINSQIYSRSGGFMGISFAIPIDVAMSVKDQLQEFGKVKRGRLGVLIQGLDEDLAQSFGLPDTTGALVARVEPDSAADKAGLQPGDVILAVNGDKVRESSELPRMIGELRPGTEIELKVWRDERSRKIDVTLGSMSDDDGVDTIGRGEEAGKLGITGRALAKEDAEEMGVKGGIVVESVSGPAEKAGLREGDVVLALNNQPVTGIDQFRQMLDAAGKRFALLVQRNDARIFVPVRIE